MPNLHWQQQRQTKQTKRKAWGERVKKKQAQTKIISAINKWLENIHFFAWLAILIYISIRYIYGGWNKTRFVPTQRNWLLTERCLIRLRPWEYEAGNVKTLSCTNDNHILFTYNWYCNQIYYLTSPAARFVFLSYSRAALLGNMTMAKICYSF